MMQLCIYDSRRYDSHYSTMFYCIPLCSLMHILLQTLLVYFLCLTDRFRKANTMETDRYFDFKWTDTLEDMFSFYLSSGICTQRRISFFSHYLIIKIPKHPPNAILYATIEYNQLNSEFFNSHFNFTFHCNSYNCVSLIEWILNTHAVCLQFFRFLTCWIQGGTWSPLLIIRGTYPETEGTDRRGPRARTTIGAYKKQNGSSKT